MASIYYALNAVLNDIFSILSVHPTTMRLMLLLPSFYKRKEKIFRKTKCFVQGPTTNLILIPVSLNPKATLLLISY